MQDGLSVDAGWVRRWNKRMWDESRDKRRCVVVMGEGMGVTSTWKT